MKISIITPCYNSASTLEEMLDSLHKQTYSSIEHIIIDGGSDDGTKSIIEKNKKRLVYWVSEPDEGIYDAMNKGIKVATGDLVGILNSDDIYSYNNVLTDVVKMFEQNDIEAMYGNLVYVDDQGNKVRYWNAGKFEPKKFFRGWMPPHPTFFVKRELYEKYGLYETDFKISADYELMLRFLYKNDVKVSYLSDVLVKMRVGGVSNKNLKNRYLAFKEDYIACMTNGLRLPFCIPILKRLTKIGQYF